MFIIGIILIILSVFIFYLSYKNFSNTHKINLEIDNENKKLETCNSNLKKENELLTHQCDYSKTELYNIKQLTKEETEKLAEIQKLANTAYDNQKEIAQKAYEQYCNRLEIQYQETDKEWQESKKLLQESYANIQSKMAADAAIVRKELDKIRATREAAQQALTREKEIKEQKEFYCLPISIADKNDIQVLERVKIDLNKPRILSMLIWSTYFQKPMTTLCNNVLGLNTICGIYKVTNQLTDECYIGQSVDVAKRWKDHAKCGLGIDTPANNKLYKAMQEDGIWNFSWELLESCPREQLDEKEKYYIQLYMSNDFGYNSTKGNK